jgi:PAS domain S-box-containing protein
MADTFGASAGLAETWNEDDRTGALRRFGILDTPQEPEFDGIARIAGHVCAAPIAAVNFIDEGRQWSKAGIGLGTRELPRPLSICAYTIRQPGLFVVPDIARDERFRESSLIRGEPHPRFFAGVPIRTSDGLPLGTVCVLDHAPRPEGLTPAQAETLETLAQQVAIQLEHREALAVLARHDAELAERERMFRTLADAMPQMVWSTRPDGSPDYFNRRWCEFTGLPEGSDDGSHRWEEALRPEDRARMREAWSRSLATGEDYEIEYPLRHRSGDYRWTLTRALPVRNEHGEIERWFGTCTDIHSHRRAEEARRESEERYRALVEASAAIVWRAAPDGSIRRGLGMGGLLRPEARRLRGRGLAEGRPPRRPRSGDRDLAADPRLPPVGHERVPRPARERRLSVGARPRRPARGR